jgi:hypothetical protein
MLGNFFRKPTDQKQRANKKQNLKVIHPRCVYNITKNANILSINQNVK